MTVISTVNFSRPKGILKVFMPNALVLWSKILPYWIKYILFWSKFFSSLLPAVLGCQSKNLRGVNSVLMHFCWHVAPIFKIFALQDTVSFFFVIKVLVIYILNDPKNTIICSYFLFYSLVGQRFSQEILPSWKLAPHHHWPSLGSTSLWCFGAYWTENPT